MVAFREPSIVCAFVAFSVIFFGNFGVVDANSNVQAAVEPWSMPLLNFDEFNYGITLQIGSQRQPFTVMIDTGSQFLWVPCYNATVAPSSSGSSGSDQSSSSGSRGADDPSVAFTVARRRSKASFNPATSATYESWHHPFHASYESGPFIGLAGSDTICFGSDGSNGHGGMVPHPVVCIDKVPFALGVEYTLASQGPFDGILGMKLRADRHSVPVGLVIEYISSLTNGSIGPSFQIIATPRGNLNGSSSGGRLWLGLNETPRTSNRTHPSSPQIPVANASQNGGDSFDWLLEFEAWTTTSTMREGNMPAAGKEKTAAEALLLSNPTTDAAVGTQLTILDCGSSLNYLPTSLAADINSKLGCAFSNSSNPGLCYFDICPPPLSVMNRVALNVRLGGNATVVSLRGLDHVAWQHGIGPHGSDVCMSAYVDGGSPMSWAVLGTPFFRTFSVFFAPPPASGARRSSAAYVVIQRQR